MLIGTTGATFSAFNSNQGIPFQVSAFVKNDFSIQSRIFYGTFPNDCIIRRHVAQNGLNSMNIWYFSGGEEEQQFSTHKNQANTFTSTCEP